MNCREFTDFLLDYLSGELPPAESVAFEEHLGECPDCVAYLAAYAQTVRLAKAACAGPDAPVPADAPEPLVLAILAARPPAPPPT